MNVPATATEFLPTDNTGFMSDTVGVGIACLAFIIFTVLSVKNQKAIFAVACIALLASIGAGAAIISNYSADRENRENLEANIKSVYDLDDVEVFRWNVNSVNVGKPTKITVVKDDMAAEVYLSQDEETLEPTLTPGPSYDDVVEWLTKK